MTDDAQCAYPLYGGPDDGLPPGLYLGLFHGFEDEQARQHNSAAGGGWGDNGPLIGPLKFVHTTYAMHISLEFTDDARARIYELDQGSPELKVNRTNGCVIFDGMEYGDWTAYVIPEKTEIT